MIKCFDVFSPLYVLTHAFKFLVDVLLTLKSNPKEQERYYIVYMHTCRDDLERHSIVLTRL